MKIQVKWQFYKSKCLLDKYLPILFMKQYFNLYSITESYMTLLQKLQCCLISPLKSKGKDDLTERNRGIPQYHPVWLHSIKENKPIKKASLLFDLLEKERLLKDIAW
ncbi:MAG TPA: hypothetical protein DCG32_06325 [Sphaerochaeta sp.]|nr:hypothetical protein [Sphaerochaeta sp.]